jgi:predicted ATPase
VRGLFDTEPLPVTAENDRPASRSYLVLRAKPRSFQLPNRGIEGLETRMVGRDAELRMVQECCEAAIEDGERAIVSVVAEAGLGKSRLLAEFGAWAAGLPVQPRCFKGRAVAAAQQQPYALLRDMFAQQFAIQDSDAAAIVLEKFERGFGAPFPGDPAAQRRAQIVGYLLGFVSADSPLLNGIADDSRQARDRGIDGLIDYFRALLRTGSALMLLEDLHWADDPSLDALTALAEALEGQRLLIVCAARPSLFERRAHWGEGQPFFTRLDLRPLSARESRRLVETILQRVDQLPAALRDSLVASADGNPFYIEELVKMLIDDGAIQAAGPRWTIDAARLAAVQVPTTLMGVLQARIDNLPPPEQTVLQRAAVVGRIFWDATLIHLREAAAGVSSLAEQELPQRFEDLRKRELIHQRERAAFSGTQEYAFKHALLRDVAYERVLKRTRRSYHFGAARWLAEMAAQAGRADEYATRIAEHYDHAGEAGEAVEWYGRAGKQAAARFANAEAVGYLSRALALMPDADAERRFDLLLARERALDLQGERAAQLEDIAALGALAERLGDRARQAVAALRRANCADAVGDYPLATAAAQQAVAFATAAGRATSEAAGHLAWGQALWRQADYPAARARLELARELAAAARLPGIEADSLRILGAVAWSQGDYPLARSSYEQALQYYDAIGHRRNEGRTRNNLGLLLWNMGDYPPARASYEQALSLFRELGDRGSESVVLSNLGLVATDQGDYASARTSYEQALALCRQIGNRQGESKALVNLGIVALAQGAYGEAQSEYERALQLCRELGNRDDESRARFNLGLVALAVGDYEAARAYFDQALAIARAIGDQRDESELLAYLSLLLHQLGEHQEAHDSARQALGIAEMMLDRPRQALALTQLGHALLGLAQRQEAADAYRRALELRQALGQAARATEPLAGLARIHVVQRDLPQALLQVGQILPRLEHGPPDGADEPFRVYLTCYFVLRASRDPRAGPLLDTAVRLLNGRAAALAAPELRRSFLERVPSNRALLAAWQSATAAGPERT